MHSTAKRESSALYARGVVLAATAALVAAVLAVAPALPGGNSPAAEAALDSEEQLFLSLINQYRQQNGLSTLSSTPTVEAAAEWMSADMGANDYFSHTDSLGRDPWTRMCDFGYCYNTWKGENIAAGTSSAQVAFDLWKGSPGHNANMLNGNFNAIGIGRVYVAGSDWGWYWTTDFGGYVPSTPTPTPAPTATPSPTPSPAPTPSPTPPPPDSDGDGFANAVEMMIPTSVGEGCGDFDTSKPGAPSQNWPADLASTGSSANVVSLTDLTSFLSPMRRFNTSPGDAGFDPRWDIAPGAGTFAKTINLQDLVAVASVKPPMFGGARAFGGPSCS